MNLAIGETTAEQIKMQIGFDKYIEDLKKKWRFLPEIMGRF